MGFVYAVLLGILSMALLSCGEGSGRIIGNSKDQPKEDVIPEAERLAALEKICAQYQPTVSGLTAVISRRNNLESIGVTADPLPANRHFTWEADDSITVHNPLLDSEGELVEFEFEWINQFTGNANIPLLDPAGDPIRHSGNVYSGPGSEEGSTIVTNFATLYEGKIINTSAETKHYYFAVRSDDGSVLMIRQEGRWGGEWRPVIDNDVNTAPQLMCSSADDLVTLAPGEIIDFRYFHRQAGGGFAVSLLWMDWGSEVKQAPGELIHINCDTVTSSIDEVFEVVPPSAFYSDLGLIPQGWTDECYELGYGAF